MTGVVGGAISQSAVHKVKDPTINITTVTITLLFIFVFLMYQRNKEAVGGGGAVERICWCAVGMCACYIKMERILKRYNIQSFPFQSRMSSSSGSEEEEGWGQVSNLVPTQPLQLQRRFGVAGISPRAIANKASRYTLFTSTSPFCCDSLSGCF